MYTRYELVDPVNGDSLGAVEVGTEMADEHVIEMLVRGGYLYPPADEYYIDDAYPFTSDGDRVIVDGEGEPVLTLTQEEPEELDVPGDDDDDDETDEPEELDSEDVL